MHNVYNFEAFHIVRICSQSILFLACQRLIFRLYRGASTEKCDVIARATRTGCRHSHRYDNGNMAA
jgi:hypothetical protein